MLHTVARSRLQPAVSGGRHRGRVTFSRVARSVEIFEDIGAFTSAPDRPGGSLGTGLFSAYLNDNDSDANRETGQRPCRSKMPSSRAGERVNRDRTGLRWLGGGARFSAGEISPATDMWPLLPWPQEGGLLAARRFACHATSRLPVEDSHPAGRNWEVEMSMFGSGPPDLAGFVCRWRHSSRLTMR